MTFGNTNEALEARRLLRDGDTEISERAFNLVIGGMLLWGFLLNYLMVALFERQISRLVYSSGPLAFLIGYFALVLIGNALIHRTGPALSFLGYNLIAVPVGVVVCLCVQGIAASTVKSAVLMTAIVTLVMMIASTLAPGFFLRMGRVLAIALIATLIGEVVSVIIFRSQAMIYEWLFAGIFSLFIGFDWARANTCAHTLDNAVDLSASMYLDIINLFLRILNLMNNRRRSQ